MGKWSLFGKAGGETAEELAAKSLKKGAEELAETAGAKQARLAAELAGDVPTAPVRVSNGLGKSEVGSAIVDSTGLGKLASTAPTSEAPSLASLRAQRQPMQAAPEAPHPQADLIATQRALQEKANAAAVPDGELQPQLQQVQQMGIDDPRLKSAGAGGGNPPPLPPKFLENPDLLKMPRYEEYKAASSAIEAPPRTKDLLARVESGETKEVLRELSKRYEAERSAYEGAKSKLEKPNGVAIEAREIDKISSDLAYKYHRNKDVKQGFLSTTFRGSVDSTSVVRGIVGDIKNAVIKEQNQYIDQLRVLDKTYRANRADIANDIAYALAQDHNLGVLKGKVGNFLDLGNPREVKEFAQKTLYAKEISKTDNQLMYYNGNIDHLSENVYKESSFDRFEVQEKNLGAGTVQNRDSIIEKDVIAKMDKMRTPKIRAEAVKGVSSGTGKLGKIGLWVGGITAGVFGAGYSVYHFFVKDTVEEMQDSIKKFTEPEKEGGNQGNDESFGEPNTDSKETDGKFGQYINLKSFEGYAINETNKAIKPSQIEASLSNNNSVERT